MGERSLLTAGTTWVTARKRGGHSGITMIIDMIQGTTAALKPGANPTTMYAMNTT